MKKLICLMLALSLVTVLFSGCSIWLATNQADSFQSIDDEVVVPDFVGMTLEEMNDHKDFHKWVSWFELETEWEFSDQPNGTIIDQSLEAGMIVKAREESITLTLSKGPKT